MDRVLIEDVGKKIDELDLNIEDYRNIDSSMFSNAKWKVCILMTIQVTIMNQIIPPDIFLKQFCISEILQVFFTEDFKKSFVNIEEARTACEITEFVKMLSDGFHPKNPQLKEGSFCSHKLLNLVKYYNVQNQSLFWTVEIFKDPYGSNYTQVLKFWDTLPIKESAKVLKKLKNIVEKYSSDYASRCRFRCLDGYVNSKHAFSYIWLFLF